MVVGSDEMQTFRAVVQRTERITPRMLRVTLGGAGLAGWTSTGQPDEYCDVYIPAAGETEPVLPIMVDGLQTTADGRPESDHRHYTVRHHDPATGEVDLDVLLHAGGIGAHWASTAEPGDVVGLGAPDRSTYRPGPDAGWQLLIGDATALPAIGRILEGLAPGTPVHVVAVVDDAAEQQEWDTAGSVDIRWIHEPDPERVGAAMQAAARAFVRPAGPGFTWVAGENVAARLIRRYLRHELGLPGSAYGTLGYWRPREEEWMARYAELAPVLEPRIEAAGEAIADDEEYDDVVQAMYEEAGL